MYTPTPEEVSRVENIFRFHAPITDSQPPRYEAVRARCGDLAKFLLTVCPPSRELSTALSQLQATMMWGNAAIAINEKLPPPPEPPVLR